MKSEEQTFIPAVNDTIADNDLPPPQSADDEALQRLWNEFNTADDKYIMYIERVVEDSHKTVVCFSAQISGKFDHVVARCRKDYIPVIEQQAEFVFKVKGKDGRWVPNGNKRMIITKSNSEMLAKGDSLNGDIIGVVTRQLEMQNLNNQRFMEKMLEKPAEESKPAIDWVAICSSPVILAAVPVLLERFLAPKEQQNQNSFKDAISAMKDMKDFIGTPEEKESGIFDQAGALLKPLIEGASAIAARSPAALAPTTAPVVERMPPSVDGSEIDKVVNAENVERAKINEIPTNAQTGEALLRTIIQQTLPGAKRDSDVQSYADVVLDQVPDEYLAEILQFVTDPNALMLLGVLDPLALEYQDWYARLLSAIRSALVDTDESTETDENLTENQDAAIVSVDPTTDNIDAKADSHDTSEHSGGTIGDLCDASPNETDGA